MRIEVIKDTTLEVVEDVINIIEVAKDGRSAYEVAVAAGFVGTVEEWLESLRGPAGGGGGGVDPVWGNVQGNISDQVDLHLVLGSKADINHDHEVADVLGLQSALDAKSPTGHTHGLGGVTGLQATLDIKADINHVHTISEVTDLQSSLDTKSTVGHTHGLSEITDLQNALDAKSPTGHGHELTDITELQSTLDAKAATIHSHGITEVTGLQSALDAKAATSHGHAILDVANLQSELNAKAATVHSHLISDVTNLQTTLDQKAEATLPGSGGDNLKVVRLTGSGTWANASNTDTLGQLSGLAIRSGGTIYGAGMSVPGFSGLSSGSVYYLSTNGSMVTIPPNISPTVSLVRVGTAINSTTLYFNPGIPVGGE